MTDMISIGGIKKTKTNDDLLVAGRMLERAMEHSPLAFLYTKLGRKTEAIEAWQLITNTLASDFNDYDSETVEWALREICKLQGV